MDKCKRCGSYAINPGKHGRDNATDIDMCDVCYWRKRAEDANELPTIAYMQGAADVKEQSRLLGVYAEREADLRGEINRLVRKIGELHAERIEWKSERAELRKMCDELAEAICICGETDYHGYTICAGCGNDITNNKHEDNCPYYNVLSKYKAIESTGKDKVYKK